jgi:hypothetical protein
MKDTIFFFLLLLVIAFGFGVYTVCRMIYDWLTGYKPPPPPKPDVVLNEREQQVFKQLCDAIVVYDLNRIHNGDGSGHTLREELLDINNKPYVKDFVPKEGQIRLGKEEWDVFVAKLKTMLEG